MQLMISINKERKNERSQEETKLERVAVCRRPDVVGLDWYVGRLGMEKGWMAIRMGHACSAKPNPAVAVGPPHPPAASQWNPLLCLRKKRSPSTVGIDPQVFNFLSYAVRSTMID